MVKNVMFAAECFRHHHLAGGVVHTAAVRIIVLFHYRNSLT